MSNIQVRGYSERGMINAICYEIRYSRDGRKLLQDLLALCTFPHAKPDFTSFRSATLIVEQSFSDFGDLDLLILLEGDCSSQAVCIEAKVKTDQASYWDLNTEWAHFCQPRNDKDRRSNLFTQLYRKMRLMRKVRNPGEELAADGLALRWSLGENRVVRRAARTLSQNCAQAWMVALVPDNPANAHAFFTTKLSSPPACLADWDHMNFGYLAWETLAEHCTKHAAEWPETVANFEYNQGQIFTLPHSGLRPPARSAVVWNSPSGPQRGIVKNGHKHHTRIYLSDGSTVRVPNRDLEW